MSTWNEYSGIHPLLRCGAADRTSSSGPRTASYPTYFKAALFEYQTALKIQPVRSRARTHLKVHKDSMAAELLKLQYLLRADPKLPYIDVGHPMARTTTLEFVQASACTIKF